ncbi:hypothetical protein ACN27F_26445 [Solwaraspora sp. WMMB335]|uniref:hypothetical protein n=1 Tax=Solwaraspora sp. WMMB335 TaxID=3404118 RepID=UPI003B941EAD
MAFNQERTGVFGDTTFAMRAAAEIGRGFPANTGVGEFAADPTLTGLAGRTAGGVRTHSVENRRQVAAFRYGPGTGRPRPAQFSRAVLLAEGGRGLVFVAGTAAVVGSNTVAADAVEQLDVTLGLVDGLLSCDAVASDGLHLSGGLGALLGLTVYVAAPADLAAVRAALAGRLPVPAVCVLSPLTRPDLLVEVDGLAVVDLVPAG